MNLEVNKMRNNTTLMQIIGGYGWKESLGALINIAV